MRQRWLVIGLCWFSIGLWLMACGGRSIGSPDPGGNENVNTDGEVPVVTPDAATCEDSPLQGVWTGNFAGQIISAMTGHMSVEGTIRLEVYCHEECLLVRGEMTGSEQSGVPFQVMVEGEYDEEQDTVWATLEGTVSVFAATGTLRGILSSGAIDRLSGTWEGEAPEVDGAGTGWWEVILLPAP